MSQNRNPFPLRPPLGLPLGYPLASFWGLFAFLHRFGRQNRI